jgi:hypothetical protein
MPLTGIPSAAIKVARPPQVRAALSVNDLPVLSVRTAILEMYSIVAHP